MCARYNKNEYTQLTMFCSLKIYSTVEQARSSQEISSRTVGAHCYRRASRLGCKNRARASSTFTLVRINGIGRIVS